MIVALAGNPNCGKTSIFNALTGARRHVANWPGVTVERRSGAFEWDGADVEVVDLPGTYSLAAQSEDERIAADFLVDPSVDVIVNVLDASNLERNLYLTTHLLELNKPIVFALNMVDDARRQGASIDVEQLSVLLGGPVVPTVGNRGEGTDELKKAIVESPKVPPSRQGSFGGASRKPDGPAFAPRGSTELRRGKPKIGRAGTGDVVAAGVRVAGGRHVSYGDDIEGELRKLEEQIARDEVLTSRVPPRWAALKLLERAPDAGQMLAGTHAHAAIERQRAASIAFLEAHLGADCATLLSERRYGFARGLLVETVERRDGVGPDFTGRLDAVLTHRWLGIPIFLLVMVAVYGVTFVVGKYPQDWIAAAFTWLHDRAAASLPAGELTSLLVDGIIPGVGAVVVFVPVIMILMGCISFLEDTGYMSRAAFIMDRLMHVMGLHGKSFIPLIMGTGCNVPAVQATRTIESHTDRFITILVAPLVSCSARLQVYILIAGTFFPPVQAAFAIIVMHVVGFGLAMVVGRVLRSTLFRGPNAPFVMELPPYRLPVLRSTLVHMWEKGRVFLTRAGTVILAGATLIWFLSHYPGIMNATWAAERAQQEREVKSLGLGAAETQARLDSVAVAYESRIMNSSLAADFGKLLQPALAPILDPDSRRPDLWKDAVALTAGFVAKEIVVGTMGVVYSADSRRLDRSLDSRRLAATTLSPLQQNLREHSGLTPLTALAFMLFTLIYTPCLGTVGMMLKETHSPSWTAFSVAYGLVLAWVLSWGLVAGGRLLGFA
jgi:ferrous iron transport protein B